MIRDFLRSILDFTDGASDGSCASPPKDHQHMDHEFQPKRVHYGYFSRKSTFSSKMRIYEKYWHECQVCGNTCCHHKDTIGVVDITDDGLEIVQGGN